MLPKCPQGHDFSAFAIANSSERPAHAGTRLQVIYCNLCGHVYGLIPAEG